MIAFTTPSVILWIPCSAGVSSNARRKVSVKDIQWADVIITMEYKHSQRLKAEFRQEMNFKELHVLEIPDDFKLMDPELVELLKETVTPIIYSCP